MPESVKSPFASKPAKSPVVGDPTLLAYCEWPWPTVEYSFTFTHRPGAGSVISSGVSIVLSLSAVVSAASN